MATKAIQSKARAHLFLEGVKLYRDDIERIVSLITQAALTERITDSDLIFDTLDDLRTTRGASPTSVTIRAMAENNRPVIEISLTSRFWTLNTYADSHPGLERDIKEILLARQSRIEHIPLFAMGMTANALLFLGFFSGQFYPKASSTIYTIAGVLLIVTGTLGLVWRMHAGLVLEYPHSAGFWGRNRESIALALFSALVGALLHYLVTLL